MLSSDNHYPVRMLWFSAPPWYCHIIWIARADILELIGAWEQALDIFKQVWEQAEARGLTETSGDMMNRMAGLLCKQGQLEKAADLYHRARERFVALGDELGTRNIDINLAMICTITGRQAEAEELYTGAIDNARKGDNRKLAGRAISGLANLRVAQGRLLEAEKLLRSRLEMAREEDDLYAQGIVTNNLGNVLERLGRDEEALELYRRRLEISWRMGDKLGQANAYGNLGAVAYKLGDLKAAEEMLKRKYRMSRELGDPYHIGHAAGNLSLVSAAKGDYAQALEYAGIRLEMAQRMDDIQSRCLATGNLGEIYQASGDYCKAEEYLLQAIDIARNYRLRYLMAQQLMSLASVYEQSRRYPEAIARVDEALAIYDEMSDCSGREKAMEVKNRIISANKG